MSHQSEPKFHPLSTLLACCGVVFALMPFPSTEVLAFDRQAILGGEVWRIWSGHIVHFSLQHAAFDLVTLFIAGGIAESILGPRKLFFALVVGAASITAGLLIWVPQMHEFRGASGIATMVCVLAGIFLYQSSKNIRVLLIVLSGLFTIRIWMESTGMAKFASSLPDGVQPAWQVHVLGAVAGTFMALYWLVRRSTVQTEQRPIESKACDQCKTI